MHLSSASGNVHEEEAGGGGAEQLGHSVERAPDDRDVSASR